MTREDYDRAVAAIRGTVLGSPHDYSVIEADWRVCDAEGRTRAYRRAHLDVIVTTGAEAGVVMAQLSELAMEIGACGLTLCVTGPGRGAVEISVSRDLDADEAVRLAGDGTGGWDRPAETTRYADVAP